MVKLTRKAIKEGLEQVPIETLLTGVNARPKLTAKQREFARKVALGSPKAKAYRETYNTKASSQVVGTDASKLSRNPQVALEIEAYKLALEAEKHRTPAQLKSLLIQQLVSHSLNEEFPPAQRVKCLELIGKLYEVGAFEERKTTTVIHESSKVKERLLSQLKTVINGKGLITDSTEEGDSLIAELKHAKAEQPPGESGEDQQPTHTPPPGTGPSDAQSATHSIPHTECEEKSAEHLDTELSEQALRQTDDDKSLNDMDKKMSLVQCTSENVQKEEGEGVKNGGDVGVGVDIGKAPLSDLDTMDK